MKQLKEKFFSLHQKIHLICNKMFHERILSGVCDAQREHPLP